MSSHAWLTRDTIPANRSGRCIFLPDDPLWRGDFYGAISSLYREYNWEKHGTLTPEQMAYEWLDVISDFLERPMACIAIGTVVDFGGSGDLPPNYLLADGSQVEQVLFPELYGIYGDTYGLADPGYFRLPNAQARFVVGTGGDGGDNYLLNDKGGNSFVVLTVAEMPSHDHTYLVGVQTPDLAGELPSLTLVSNAPSLTGLTGGNQGHENRPKYIAFRKCVVAY